MEAERWDSGCHWEACALVGDFQLHVWKMVSVDLFMKLRTNRCT